VVIIGAGPAGLAVGAARAARGLDATLLERDRVGSAWHRHYERLHLHTIRARVGDAATTAIARVFIGDLSRHGLPRPSDRLVSRHRARGAVPVLDVGLAGLLKRGRVAIVPAIATLEPGGVVLVDGSRVSADAIVVATGYATGLEALVGGLGVLTSTGAPPWCTVRRRSRAFRACTSSASRAPCRATSGRSRFRRRPSPTSRRGPSRRRSGSLAPWPPRRPSSTSTIGPRGRPGSS
jgi:glycine/D-amino acid oxidase-like deaminating enzyme